GVAYQVAEVSAAGVFRTQSAGTVMDPPLALVRTPFRAGDTWAFNTAGLDGTKKVLGVEAVKVPAGTFDAVRIETDYTTGGVRRKSEAWYAPGVGLIKLTEDGRDTMLLKSFTPGK
ncbi:MAG: DUF3108 domain-containing protein, partial [Gemmataceae bacterium]|nr:DUF3108 domain-containing protein [Gemmataceae bacterium]